MLALLALLTLVGSFLYLGPLLAVPTFLLFALALPIYLGWKRVRDLAIVGLVVLLAAAPIASALDAQQIRIAPTSASSDSYAPYGNGTASVLTNALVTPYLGPVGGVYDFSVDVNPAAVPFNGSSLLWVTLYVSTCPGATGNSSPFCSSGYPYFEANQTLPANLSTPIVVSFNQSLGDGAQIWWWQMSTAYYANYSTSQLVSIFLDVPTYGSQEGPVTGPYSATFELVLVPILEALLIYAGTVFFFALLVYMYFRGRRQRRGAPPPAPLPAAPGPDGQPAGPATTAGPTELKCPNCRALVYPNEANCWKCGTSLKAAPATAPDAPLASGKSP